MKRGDLVKFRTPPLGPSNPAIGILIKIDTHAKRGYHSYGIMWDFLPGEIAWQRGNEIEVLSEAG
jgi:hypothetical protein